MCCFYLSLILYLTFDFVFILLFCSFLFPSFDYTLVFFSGILLFNNSVPSTGRRFRTYSNKIQGNIANYKNLPLFNEISHYDQLSRLIEDDVCFNVSRGVGVYII